ncbi:MAG: septation protein IspZ [Rickettsiales endosymbiont of Dermacentor nuttalli]
MQSFIKILGDIIPIFCFFILYKKFDLIVATTGLVIINLAINIITFIYKRKLSTSSLISSGLLIVMGGITIFTGNSNFIKLKITIINIVFAAILYIGAILNKGLLKYLFGKTLTLSEQFWIKFSKRWALFFLLIAIANEFVWRNFSDDIWVKFKVFGVLGCTIIFILSQIPFLSKGMAMTENNSSEH